MIVIAKVVLSNGLLVRNWREVHLRGSEDFVQIDVALLFLLLFEVDEFPASESAESGSSAERSELELALSGSCCVKVQSVACPLSTHPGRRLRELGDLHSLGGGSPLGHAGRTLEALLELLSAVAPLQLRHQVVVASIGESKACVLGERKRTLVEELVGEEGTDVGVVHGHGD